MTLPRATMPTPSDARTGPMGFRTFTPRAYNPQGRRPFTSDEIRNFVVGQGWAGPQGVTNPRAIYDEAQRRGNISAAQLDTAGGFSPGFAANYIQQQGWDPLRGRQGDARVGPIPGQAPQGQHAALANALLAQRTGPRQAFPTPQPAQPAFAQVGQGGKAPTYLSPSPYAPKA